MTENAIQFGNLLRSYRTRAALTQKQLAEAADVSLWHVNRIENGRRLPPGREKILDLIRVLSRHSKMGQADAEVLLEVAGYSSPPDHVLLENQAEGFETEPGDAAGLMAELMEAIRAGNRSMLQQVSALDQRLNQRLDAVQQSVANSLSATSYTIGKVGEKLGSLNAATERIIQAGRDVSSLKDVLQPPKLRGGFGELLLEQLVKQVLSEHQYSMQHRFDDGTVVDLVIHSPQGLIPVDSKFPLESFRRLLQAETDDDRGRLRKAFVKDVKVRIDEVAKYIRPDKGTLDFALMYVPAENVYYETIAGTEDHSPMSYALEQQVHICSPNTFHAFLQVVLRGFRGLNVEQEAKQIMERLAHVRREFGEFNRDLEVLGTHIYHAVRKYDELDRRTVRLGNLFDFPQNRPTLDQGELPEQVRPPLTGD